MTRAARDARVHLHDAARACDLIADFTRDRTVDDYRADPMLRSAVERQFEIVGEALRRARDAEPALDIPSLDRIVAFRNRLAHGYASISPDVVWGIVESRLPALARAVRERLGG